GVKALAADLIVNSLPQLPPALDWSLETESGRRLDSPVERHPSHHAGMSEGPTRATHFPDAFVRLVPGRFEKTEQGPGHPPCILLRLESDSACVVQRRENFAVNVELKLG